VQDAQWRNKSAKEHQNKVSSRYNREWLSQDLEAPKNVLHVASDASQQKDDKTADPGYGESCLAINPSHLTLQNFSGNACPCGDNSGITRGILEDTTAREDLGRDALALGLNSQCNDLTNVGFDIFQRVAIRHFQFSLKDVNR
jgi:hypothetical protein